MHIPLTDDLSPLKKPVRIGSHTAANAIAIQPMEGCDGTADGRPGELTLRRYDRFAKSGAGLIWAEACAIVPEGRANPRQLWLTAGNLDDYKKFVEGIKETCRRENGFEPVVILQATHSGRYSKPEGVPAPLIAYNNPIFEGDRRLQPTVSCPTTTCSRSRRSSARRPPSRRPPALTAWISSAATGT